MVAHQVLKEIEILLVLLLKSKLSEQFQSALLGTPLVPPTKDSARTPHLEEEGNSSQKYIPTAAMQKETWAEGCPCHPSVSSYFTQGKRGSWGKLSFQQEICLILLVLQSLRLPTECLLKEEKNKIQSTTWTDKTYLAKSKSKLFML